MSNLPERVEESIRKRGLLRRGQAVLVAVSGGVDSMVLLHVLHALSRQHAWRLAVAHLNHRLRGRSSDADERLVLQVGRRLGLPVAVERADVKAFARTEKLSLEMAARRVRHGFLARAAARLKIRTIAVAHHADDQLELFFLRLFRGSGGEGLAGMKWRSPSPEDRGIALVRPLLDLSKSELRQFAVRRKIAFREDATNASPDIQRNRIRHELLPLLRRAYQPALDRTLLRVMDIVGADAEFVTGTAAEWLRERKRAAFGKLPVAVQRRCIQLQLRQCDVAADYDLIERLRTVPGRPVTIAPGQAVVAGSEGMVRRHRPTPALAETTSLEVKLERRAGEITLRRLRIRWSIRGHGVPFPPKPLNRCEFFDAGRVGSPILLRHWRPGDRFQPIGMARPVKLQDLFVNQKIARERRHELMVAATASGELFWVEGLRISERFKLFEGTNRCLQWQWKPL